MKTKHIQIILLLLIGSQFLSCKKEVKKADAIQYIIESKTTTINWTAYKTTEKKPVKGVFKIVNIENPKLSNDPFKALNNLKFSIPVNSIDTKNKDRDTKLINSFFGTMKNTQNITGIIKLEANGIGNVNLTMNGITTLLPITYVISGQLIDINATLDLNNWQAKLAIDALNLVCNEKHKGADGISKTWDEVNIHIISYLKVK